MANLISCIVMAVVMVQAVTANQDLKVERYRITNDIPPIYSPGEQTTITLDLQVMNVGSEELHSIDTPYFYVVAYFTDNVEEEYAHERSAPMNLTVSDPHVLNGPFPQGAAVNLTALTGTITFGKEHCFHYDHLCVQIMPANDDDPWENDDFCLRVGAPPPGGVGHLHCTDLIIEDFKITSPVDMKFRAGMREHINATISIKNVGPVDIPAKMAVTAYGLDLYLEGPEASKILGFVRPQKTDRNLTHIIFNGRDHKTNPSNVVTIDDLHLEVLLDKANCEKYQELCVRILPSMETRSDEDDDAEDHCLPFHLTVPKGGAGMKDCDYVIKAKEDKSVSEDPSGGYVATVSIAALIFSFVIAKFL